MVSSRFSFIAASAGRAPGPRGEVCHGPRDAPLCGPGAIPLLLAPVTVWTGWGGEEGCCERNNGSDHRAGSSLVQSHIREETDAARQGHVARSGKQALVHMPFGEEVVSSGGLTCMSPKPTYIVLADWDGNLGPGIPL